MEHHNISIFDRVNEYHDSLCSSLSGVLDKPIIKIQELSQHTDYCSFLAISQNDESYIEFSIFYNDSYLVYDFTLEASISAVDQYIVDDAFFYEYYAIYNNDFEYQENILTLRLEGVDYPRVILVIPKNSSSIDGTFSTNPEDDFHFTIPDIANFNDSVFGGLSRFLFDIFIKNNNSCVLFSIDQWISSILKEDKSDFLKMYKLLEIYNE